MRIKLGKIFLQGFIFLHLLMIAVWSFPTEMKYKAPIDHFFESYMYFTGLWQGWDMFAPNPRSTLLRMDASVYFQDGSRKIWEFPQMEKLSLFERFQKERFRKWAHDNVRLDNSSGLWKPTGEYIARQFKDPLNPVTRVELSRYWYELKIQDEGRKIASNEWQHFMFYKYEVPK